MTMIGRLWSQYLEFNARFIAYAWGHLLLAIFYLMTLLIPPMRVVLSRYYGSPEFKTILMINGTATALLLGVFPLVIPNYYGSGIVLLVFLIVGLAIGQFALTMLWDYKYKNRTGISQEKWNA